MLISRNWLNEYVSIPKSLSPQDLALKLTMAVVEVEGWQNQGEMLGKVVVARVLKIDKHPNADKLKIAQVDVGKEKLNIVCGGVNLRKGMLVAVALVGAKVRWHGEEEWSELKPVKIRGVESLGMICAAEELGLSENMNPERGILDITETGAKVGASFQEAMRLDDTIFEIDNKSITHRPDLWGHFGMAREVAALLGAKLKNPELQKLNKGGNKKLSVQVMDKALCPRYCGLVINNIEIKPSPFWLQQRLSSLGIRPINNIVDVTNLVLLELGQPLHAFDYSLVPDGKIIVRRAEPGEKIRTIDDEQRKLKPEMLVIASVRGSMAVAGVMGGAESEITEKTKTIILESANFEPYSIRKTSAELGLRTESSIRFEKSLDPEVAKQAIQRAAKLILDLCPGAEIASALVDQAKYSLNQGPINLDLDFVNKKIGMDIAKKQVIAILRGLGFGIKDKGKFLSVKIPTWRATKDISLPEDLVEEIARIYGYDNIDIRLPKCDIAPPPQNGLRNLEHKTRDILVGLGAAEVYNYSFVGIKDLDDLEINEKCVKLQNPIAADQDLMRPSLLPNLLKNIAANQHGYHSLAIFEIGSIYLDKKSKRFANPKKKTYLPEEVKMLGAAFCGQSRENQFVRASRVLQNLFYGLGLKVEYKKISQLKPYQHPSRVAEIFVHAKKLGQVFELHPSKNNGFDIRERVAYFEINLQDLLEISQKHEIKFQPLPKFPSVRRDLALVCPEVLDYKELEQAIFGASKLVASINLFDIYRGKSIPENTKSMALHLEFRHPEKTLEAEEVDRELEIVLNALKSNEIELRK